MDPGAQHSGDIPLIGIDGYSSPRRQDDDLRESAITS
jgi:hypothetical protein